MISFDKEVLHASLDGFIEGIVRVINEISGRSDILLHVRPDRVQL